MKKLNNILKQLDSIPLPDKNKILSFNNSNTSEAKKNNAYNRVKFKFRPVYVSFIVLFILIASFSGYKIIADETEYKEAVNFFIENELSIVGLSKSDIKNVYRDITTKRFSLSKTAEIIEKNISEHKIFQDAPSPEDIENLWNYKNSNGHYIIKNNYSSDINYEYRYIEKVDEETGYVRTEKTNFIKYENGNVQWLVLLDNFLVNDFIVSNDYILIYGTTLSYPSISSQYASRGRLALINKDGEIIWDKTIDNSFKNEQITAALIDNEEIVTISMASQNLCFTKYDLQGNITTFTNTKMDGYYEHIIIKLGDDYLVKHTNAKNEEILIKINNDGTLSDSFSFSSTNSKYFITNMIEYNNNVFISAYAVPKLNKNDNDAGGRADISNILNYIFENKKMDISNEELTKIVRENFTAILLVYNTETEEPEEFYSVNASLGSKLYINENNNLIWETENISDTYFSPYTSSFTIGGACYIYKYEFDEFGNIKGIEKTNEVTIFRR